MNYFEFWVFITFGWIAWISSLLLVVGFLLLKKLRDPPGDIIFGLSIADLGLTTHWLVSAIWSGHLARDLSLDPTFCTINSAISIGSAVLAYCYSISLNYFLVKRMGNALRDSEIPKYRYHVFSVITCIYLVGYSYNNDLMGLNAYGTCSIKKVEDPSLRLNLLVLASMLLVIINGIYGIYTYFYIKANIPKSDRINHQASEFLSYYNTYVFVSFVVWFLASVAALGQYIFEPESVEDSNFWPPLASFFKSLLPLILTVIRYNDPMVKAQIKQLLILWKRGEFTTRISNARRSTLNPIEIALLPKKSSAAKKSLSSHQDEENPDIESKVSEFENETGMVAITLFLETQARYTVLAGARYCFKEYQELMSLGRNGPYSHKLVVSLNEELIMKKFPDYEFGKYPPLDGTFSFYRPDIFFKLLSKYNPNFDLLDSLHLNQNIEAIKGATGAADGGRSGEFFMFLSDNRLVIKTIHEEDHASLLRALESLSHHYETNPNSLIAKIYGLFTFEKENAGSQLHFIIMENISLVPNKYILRRYDLKGSTHDRDALKGSPIESLEKPIDKTLKDLNFLKYEKNIRVNETICATISEAVEKDAEFFQAQGIMDYSLMLFVIDRKKLLLDAIEDPELNKFVELVIPEWPDSQGLGYRLGIIDYLQVFNTQKLLELNLKRIKAVNYNVDISAQPPDFYARRFSAFVRKSLGV